MEMNRREVLAAVGCTAVAAGLAPGASAATQPQPFDITRSHFRVGSAMAIPAMGAALGAAAIWRDRTGEAQDLAVDLRESVYNVNPLIGGIKLMMQRDGIVPAADDVPRDFVMPTINGLLPQAPLGLGNPVSFVPFETRDGRFFNLTGIYPHLMDRALNVLKCPPGGDNIRAAFRKVDAVAFEDALAAAGGVGVVHRTRSEWLAHPEGKVLAAMPLIEIIKIAGGPPVPWDADPVQPLSGLKVMSNTHVIAALRRRAREGGSYHVRVSLTRAAMWYASLGRFPDTKFDLSGPANRMMSPEILVADTPYGQVRRLGPQVKLSRTPGKWRTPLVAVRGADTVSWGGRAA